MALLYANLGKTGCLPAMPGTWGSALAALLAPFIFMPLGFFPRLILLAAVFVTGALAADRAEQVLKAKDPGQVVVDELAGQWMTFLFFPALGLDGYVAGFVFFRVFDMVKPWPIKYLEQKVPGGWGVMADDIAAGIYAAVCLGIYLGLTG